VSALIAKTSAKLEKMTESLEKQRKLVAGSDWAEKVSEAIRDQELSRIAESEAQAQSLASSIDQFKKLTLQKS
jgi:hypothetical protein